MQEINELKTEICDLKTSLEFTQKNLKGKVAQIEKKLVSITGDMTEIYDYQIDSEYYMCIADCMCVTAFSVGGYISTQYLKNRRHC